MKYFFIFAICFTSLIVSAKEQSCFQMIEHTIYELEPNVDICIDSGNSVNLVHSGFENTSIFKLRGKMLGGDSEQIIFPREEIKVANPINILVVEKMFIYKDGHNIILVDAKLAKKYEPKKRSRRSTKDNLATVGGAAIGSVVGTNGNASPKGTMNVVIGSSAGIAVGLAVSGITKNTTLGIVSSEVVSGAVTNYLNTHTGNSPPLTIINTNKSLLGKGTFVAPGCNGPRCRNCHD